MASTRKNDVLKKMREKPVEEHLKDMCEMHGGFALKLNPAWNIGVPDRLCVWACKFWNGKYNCTRIAFIETKRPKGGRLSGAQIWWRNRLTKLGLEWHLCSTKEEVDQLIG